MAALDDRLRDLAMLRLRDATRLTAEAADALRQDVKAVEAMRRRYGHAIHESEVATQQAAARAEELAEALTDLRKSLNTFKGVQQIRTKREWDTFLSETAEELLEVGFTPREVASILTGTPTAKVSTATLERFRQRVRRLKETRT